MFTVINIHEKYGTRVARPDNRQIHVIKVCLYKHEITVVELVTAVFCFILLDIDHCKLLMYSSKLE